MVPIVCLIVFDGLPNDMWLAIATMIGVVIPGVCILSIYFFLPSTSTNRDRDAAVMGKKYTTPMCLFALGVDLFLLGRVTTSMPGNFFEVESVNKSWWCVVRILATGLVSSAIVMLESHYFFRLYTLVSLPLFTAVSMISEIDLAHTVECERAGICDAEDEMVLSLFVYRDLLSILTSVGLSVLVLWLTSHYGFTRNYVRFPRKEHREFRHIAMEEVDDQL